VNQVKHACLPMKPRASLGPVSSERGGVLIEFAFLSLVFYVLVALVVDLGRMVFAAQVLQDAARVAARELSLMPLPAAMTFEEALEVDEVKTQVFDQALLVIDLEAFGGDDVAFQTFLDQLPMVNKMLRPLMIFEQMEVQGATRQLLRYPGALLHDPSAPSGLGVGIPRVESRGEDGVEAIRWVPVLEEISNGAFSLVPSDPENPPPQRGLVAVRINYPFQAAMLSGFQQGPGGPFEPNLDNRIQAADESVNDSANAPPGGTPFGVGELPETGVYGGRYGLGGQFAFGGEILRPYRKLLSAQAISRREVFL
jgi:hypothetical protein